MVLSLGLFLCTTMVRYCGNYDYYDNSHGKYQSRRKKIY